MRSLAAEEEYEFQCAVPSHSTNNPAIEATPTAPAEAAVTYPILDTRSIQMIGSAGSGVITTTA